MGSTFRSGYCSQAVVIEVEVCEALSCFSEGAEVGCEGDAGVSFSINRLRTLHDNSVRVECRKRSRRCHPWRRCRRHSAHGRRAARCPEMLSIRSGALSKPRNSLVVFDVSAGWGYRHRGKHWPFEIISRSGSVSVIRAENAFLDPTLVAHITRFSLEPLGKIRSIWYFLCINV